MYQSKVQRPQSLGSDNHSGVHPEIMAAINHANHGHAPAYGTDDLTSAAEAVLGKHFPGAQPFFVFNGTAANVLALHSMLPSHAAVMCAATAHLHRDECGAPEYIVGCKILPLPSYDGKISPEDIDTYMVRGGDQHYAFPRVLSISQPTELGTIYTLAELRALASAARQHHLLLHMDGARLVNAAAALDVSLMATSGEAGVDVLSFGGTKNGLLFGEAVIFFNTHLAENFKYMRKQSLQLASKMRFIAAQFIAFLEGDLWHRNACHANAMARYLAEEVRKVPQVTLTRPVQANAVFAKIPQSWVKPLRQQSFFYVWDERTFEVRWMTSFDTDQQELAAFCRTLRQLSLAG